MTPSMILDRYYGNTCITCDLFKADIYALGITILELLGF